MFKIFKKKCPICRMSLEEGKKYPEGFGKQFYSDQDIAQDVERSEVRIAAPAKEVFEEMTGVVRQQIDPR